MSGHNGNGKPRGDCVRPECPARILSDENPTGEIFALPSIPQWPRLSLCLRCGSLFVHRDYLPPLRAMVRVKMQELETKRLDEATARELIARRDAALLAGVSEPPPPPRLRMVFPSDNEKLEEQK